jgi:hypothetical protein
MAHFITANTKSVNYRGCQPSGDRRDEIITNHPVNIDLCTHIIKSRMKWYPDNTGMPSILLKGVEVEWVYNSEKDRDEDFEALTKSNK